ncbi:MAG TPA: thiamine ABC transporter substrate-binding protein [Thermoplasmata archaeon]|nr:thiamine ABC transporter substrate-binding protein [Thermoplasmata archaeon]
MTGSPIPTPPHRRRVRRPGRLRTALLALAIALVVVVTGFGAYEYYASGASAGGTTLVVYTYSSFFGGNCGAGAATLSSLLGQFERAHGVRVELVCPSGNLVSALQSPAEYGLPAADLVVGLDEVTAPEAESHGLLAPYSPSELASIPPWIVSELSPDHGVVPYEYGFLAIDYSPAFLNETGGAVARASLPELVGNASWSSQLVVESPLYDITGEEFLAWQVEYYETVLHQNWQGFWQRFFAEPHPNPAPDWSTAFGEFATPAGEHQLVVSYATDPAYALANGGAGTLNATVSWWNGTAYGWRTIYGLGVVQGSRHATLARELEDWILGGPFQSNIAENEWEYPANGTVALPSVFSAAIDPSSVVALNNATTPAAVAANLTAPGGWIDTWQNLAGSSG